MEQLNTVQPDIGHYVLLAVILIMVIKGLVTEYLNKNERSEMSKRLMARSLTEYTQSTLDTERASRGELSEEEEREIRNEVMRKDRIPV